MAATPFPPSLHTSFSPFDIFRDGGAPQNTPPPPGPSPSLPGGPCNFVELSHGPNGPRCGCRRFWSSQAAGIGNRNTDQMGWCMCSHHACFHDDAHTTQAGSAPLVENVLGQENEKPRSNRDPLSPVQDYTSFHMPTGLGGAAMDFATLNFDSFPSNLGRAANPPQYQSQQQYHPPRSIPPGPAPDTDSFPDTLSWRNFNSTQGGQTPFPPIPSPCLMPHSQSASTTASSQMRYLRPFGGKGMNTLSRVSHAQQPGQDETTDTDTGAHTTPDLLKECHTRDDINNVPSGAATPTPVSARSMGTPRPTSALAADQSNGEMQGLTDTVEDHEQRLESLECGSVYNTALEEFSDKHDLADLRVTELEHRMDDVERRLTDENTSVTSSHPTTQRDDDATASGVSASFSVLERVAERVAARFVEPLQARVARMESYSPPSYTSPWELEVVFLPFPLKGIWIEAQEFKARLPFRGQDESPNTNSRATPMPQALTTYDEWVGQDSDWLLPKACVPGRMIDQRLRSRGFSKTVQIRGSEYRSVQLAIGNAFESILCMMPHPDSPRSPYAADSRVVQHLGLQQYWVPLRKVHKDPRLRFLSSSELLTPATWTSAFLLDSVVMKATGMHRLYITQPEAYLQDNYVIRSHSVTSGWAWRKLREINRVYPDSQTSNVDTPEADAREEHWAFDARLDDPPNARQSSISRMTDESSEQFHTAPIIPSASMASPVFTRGQSPLTHSERKGSRTPYARTGSVPPNYQDVTPLARSGRFVSSHPPHLFFNGPSYQRHPSPLGAGRSSPRAPIIANSPAKSMIIKNRRRNTRSPSFRPYNPPTPRHSNRSMSLSPSVTVQTLYNITYMTPHSNAPLVLSPRQINSSHDIQFDEEEEDDDDMEFDDDRGSLTDQLSGESDDDVAQDDDDDMSLYADKADMLDNLPQGPQDIPRQGIEDVIYDGESMESHGYGSGDEGTDDESDTASSPSEYPSKLEENKQQLKGQWSGVGDVREGTSALEDAYGPELDDFLIHEDKDGEKEEEPEAHTLY